MKWLWGEGEAAEIPSDNAAQWRAALQRETMRLRAIRPIPTLESLSELHRQQAAVIARNIAPWTKEKEKEMARRGHSALFISTLEGLAALKIRFPSALLTRFSRFWRTNGVNCVKRKFQLFQVASIDFSSLAANFTRLPPQKTTSPQKNEPLYVSEKSRKTCKFSCTPGIFAPRR